MLMMMLLFPLLFLNHMPLASVHCIDDDRPKVNDWTWRPMNVDLNERVDDDADLCFEHVDDVDGGDVHADV